MTAAMHIIAIIAVAIVIFMLIKKMDIKITLLLMGIVLMFVGAAPDPGRLLRLYERHQGQ